MLLSLSFSLHPSGPSATLGSASDMTFRHKTVGKCGWLPQGFITLQNKVRSQIELVKNNHYTMEIRHLYQLTISTHKQLPKPPSRISVTHMTLCMIYLCTRCGCVSVCLNLSGDQMSDKDRNIQVLTLWGHLSGTYKEI